MRSLSSSVSSVSVPGAPPAAARDSPSATKFLSPGAYLMLKSNSLSQVAQRTWRGVAIAEDSTYCSD